MFLLFCLLQSLRSPCTVVHFIKEICVTSERGLDLNAMLTQIIRSTED
jgi:hypothetical protein